MPKTKEKNLEGRVSELEAAISKIKETAEKIYKNNRDYTLVFDIGEIIDICDKMEVDQ